MVSLTLGALKHGYRNTFLAVKQVMISLFVV